MNELRNSPQAVEVLQRYFARVRDGPYINAFPTATSGVFERDYSATTRLRNMLRTKYPVLADLDVHPHSKELWCLAFRVLVNGQHFRRALTRFLDCCTIVTLRGSSRVLKSYTLSFRGRLTVSGGDAQSNTPFTLKSQSRSGLMYGFPDSDNNSVALIIAPLEFKDNMMEIPTSSYSTFYGLLLHAFEITCCFVDQHTVTALAEASGFQPSRILATSTVHVSGVADNDLFRFRRVWPLREFLSRAVAFPHNKFSNLRLRALHAVRGQLPIFVDVQCPSEQVKFYLCKRRGGTGASMLSMRNRILPKTLRCLFRLFPPSTTHPHLPPIVQLIDALASGKLPLAAPVSLLCKKLTTEEDVPTAAFDEIKVLGSLRSECRDTLRLSETQKKTLGFQQHRSQTSVEDEFRVPVQKVILDLHARTMLRVNNGRQTHHYGGIIANETGTGKTLSLLLWTRRSLPTSPSCLIVVPDELITHWQGEIDKYFDETQRFEIYDALSLPESGILQSFPGRCAVVSHSFIRHRNATVAGMWTDLIIDEAHRCKTAAKLNQNLQGLRRRNTWAITATPQSHLGYLTQLLQVPTQSTIAETLTAATVIRRLMYKGTLERKHMTVTRSVVFCETTTAEQAFFQQVSSLVNRVSDIRRSNMKYLNRFFRILERVSSGGALNGVLMLAILKRVLEQAKSLKRSRAVAAEEQSAPACAIGDEHQDCAVCMSELLDPIQLSCRHAFCTSCVQGMADVGHRHCPLCRTPICRYYRPVWEGDVDVTRSPPRQEVKIDKGEFVNLLKGAGDGLEDGTILRMNGKRDTFRQHIAEWWQAQRDTCAQLLVFVKYAHVAKDYQEETKRLYGEVRLSGFDQSRRQAVADIDGFKEGAFRVLILSTKYCAGFDLVSANEVWLMNTDLKTCKMDQSLGRVVRMSQTSREVNVKVFLYASTFDEFTWRFKHLGELRYTKGNLILLEYFFHHRTPGTIFFDVHNGIKRLYPQVLRSFNDVTAAGNIITFRGTIAFNTLLRTLTFIGRSRKYTMREFLERGAWTRMVESILRNNKQRVDRLNEPVRVY